MASLTGGILGQALRGKSGNVVFVNVGGETRVRRRVVPHNPQSPAQQAGRWAHGRASAAWSGLDAEARGRWAAWAVAQGGKGQTAFVALYGKALRIDPQAPPPPAPPARPFFGDATVVSASPVAPGLVRFSASLPNRPGVVTELLIQPLLSPARRTYLDKYRHAAYVAFAAGSLGAEVAAAGWVACGMRFVEAATGQATGIVELGLVRVD